MFQPGDDTSLWTEDRIRAEISLLLPRDQVLESSLEKGAWVFRCLRKSSGEEQPQEVLWEVEHYYKREALFEAYGRLWLERHPAQDSLWSTGKTRPTQTSVRKYAISKDPDPGDLDPDEVAAVYKGGPS